MCKGIKSFFMFIFPPPQLKKLSNFGKEYICSESYSIYLKGKPDFRIWGEVLSTRA